MAKKGVFIDREKIVASIREIGSERWEDFVASELIAVGNGQRCEMTADGKSAMLNLFFNKDGTTTITPTGKNIEISTTIKTSLEAQCGYSGFAHGKTCSIKHLPGEWREKLIGYLSSLEDVVKDEYTINVAPNHKSYVFSSKIGDRLTINAYQNGTLTLQGRPAYLYGEALSFLSYCNDVSVDDIVNSTNKFHDVNIKTNDVRNDMEFLMPVAYKNIDETILKLLSPSISLRKVKIDLEDYSCYAFPALRALEGYIKYLLGLKGIVVGKNFANIFCNGTLTPATAAIIGDSTFEGELDRLYDYFQKNRHVIFHADQILIGTKLLEDKHEADEIVNTVLNLIESSYENITK